MSFIGIRVRLHMLIDVGSRWIIFWITGHADRIGALVDSDVVESHRGWKYGLDTGKIDGRETGGHAEIHDQTHRLLRDHPLANIAIWPDGSVIELPAGNTGHGPRDVSSGTGIVIEAVLSVVFAVVPVVVEIGQTRHGFLIRASLVRVDHCDLVIVDLHEVCRGLEGYHKY